MSIARTAAVAGGIGMALGAAMGVEERIQDSAAGLGHATIGESLRSGALNGAEAALSIGVEGAWAAALIAPFVITCMPATAAGATGLSRWGHAIGHGGVACAAFAGAAVATACIVGGVSEERARLVL